MEFVIQFTMNWMNNMNMKYDSKQNLTAHSSSAKES